MSQLVVTSLDTSAESAAPRVRWRPASRLAAVGWFLLSLLIILVFWQTLVVVLQMPKVLLPAPIDVANSMWERRELLAGNAAVTVINVLFGFVLSLAIGIPVAVAIAFSRVVERLVYPILVVSQAIPKVAIAPILLIWFGFGATTNVVLAVSLAVFPIIINLSLGLTQIDPDLVRLARVMGASRLRLFALVRLPNALPNLLAGMKLAITFSAIGVVVGEFFAGSKGLGYVAQAGAGVLDTSLTFAAIVILSFITVVLFYAVALLESIVLRGRQSADGK